MRVGPQGLLQTLADAVKMLLKEDIILTDANKFMFRIAPVISFLTAATCLTVVPFSDAFKVADVKRRAADHQRHELGRHSRNYFGRWASNSHYSLLGSLRSAAQLVSYEVALGLALMCE